MRKNILDIIVNVILILAFILAVYWFIQLIFGGSPELSEFNSLLIVMMMGVLFNIYREKGNFNREFGEFKIKTINGFERMKDDIDLIKKKLKI